MAIFLTGQSRVLIQGITGSEGRRHGSRMLAAGTQVVGGTNPRKAGQAIELNGTDVPVFGTVAEVMAATGADVSVVFVPAERTKDAVIEAIEADNPGEEVLVEDAGGYIRISVPQRCRLSRASLETALGYSFELSKLELSLSAFAGRMKATDDEVLWYLERQD